MDHQLRRPPVGRRGQDTIDRLLAAADRLLAEEGARALRTTRIAEEAGMAVGTVYNWFPDKTSIAEALAIRYWAELTDLLAAVTEAAEAGTIADPVTAGIDTLAAGFRARPGFLALWFGGLRTERVRDSTRHYREEVATGVGRLLAVDHPEITREHRATIAGMVVLLGDAILREAFRIAPQGDPTVLAEGTAAVQAYVAARVSA